MLINIPTKLLTDRTLPSSAKILYGFLHRQKEETNENICKLSAQAIADSIGVERATVPRLVLTLQAEGWLKIHEGLSVKRRPQYEYEVLSK